MRSWLGLGSIALVAGSWRLWTPQHLFPRVPLFEFALAWPDAAHEWLTWGCLGLWLMVSLLLVIPQLPKQSARWLAGLYALCFFGLVLLDQHRLQPWGVHIAVCLWIVTCFEGKQLISWLIAFTASIYIYSAISKFDAQFLHTVGQDFLAALLRFWPGGYAALSETGRLGLAALFPIGELLCGLGLLWTGTRRLAAIAAALMHSMLIWLLGPWGLAHSWGVLLWNLVFLGLAILLWFQLGQQTIKSGPAWQWTSPIPLSGWGKLKHAACLAGLVVVMVAPLGERWGLVDHWLGWALYAPHSSRARIELLTPALEQQPMQMRKYLQADKGEQSLWANVAVERWSLETLGVPVYPQQRFYVAVARQVAREADEFGVRVTLLGVANRWSGQRDQRVIDSRQELERTGETYWFNTQPR